MQPTTLNKVISLFLIGGLVLLVLAFVVWDVSGPLRLSREMADLMKQAGPALLAVIGGLLVVSLATVLGVACEALTDLTVRRALKEIGRRPSVAAFFGQGNLLAEHDYWRDAFNSTVWGNDKLRMPLAGYKEHSLAVAVFYRSAPAQAIEWVQSHYATYILATNLAFLSLAAEVYVVVGAFSGLYQWVTVFVVTCVLVILSYAFVSHALDRYLYSYQFPMRHGAIALLMEESEVKGDVKSA